MQTGIFPEKLKIANVKAVYKKKGDKSVINNYRPIALLSNISKIFEKIIYSRLINYLESQNLLSNTQNGFRKNKSTIRACYQALCEVINSLNNKEHTVVIGLDLSKAFDCVDHNILIRKLEKYGIGGIALKLLVSYLSNRLQCIVELDSNGELYKNQKN